MSIDVANSKYSQDWILSWWGESGTIAIRPITKPLPHSEGIYTGKLFQRSNSWITICRPFQASFIGGKWFITVSHEFTWRLESCAGGANRILVPGPCEALSSLHSSRHSALHYIVSILHCTELKYNAPNCTVQHRAALHCIAKQNLVKLTSTSMKLWYYWTM